MDGSRAGTVGNMSAAVRLDLQAIGNLLGEEVATVGNPAIERHGREIRAALALLLGPLCYRRYDLSRYAAENVEQAIVSADCANLAAVVAAVRAEPDKLKEAMKIFAVEIPALNTGNFPHAFGEFDPAAGGNDRAAVPHEELQESCNRKNADDRCHNHRALTIKRAVAKRASSGTFEKV